MSRLLALFFLFQVGNSLKHTFSTKDDDRAIIGPLGFPFGFLDTGHYNMTVSEFSISYGSHGDKDDHAGIMKEIEGIGFLLKKFDDESHFYNYINRIQQNGTECVFQPYLDQRDDIFDDDQQDGVGEVLNAEVEGVFLDMTDEDSRWAPKKPWVSYDFRKGEAGYYFLIFQICPTPKDPFHSHFVVDFHFSNQDIFQNLSFLSAGEMVLPHVFFYFFILYSICLYLWATNIRMISEGGFGHFADPDHGHPVVYPIHRLMTVLLAGAILFTVILLIGSGWSFVKPLLSDREKKMILAILVLQVINNIAIVVLTQETEGELAFDSWTAILHLVDIVCCCAVLIPIVWHVNTLEKNMELSNGADRDIHETSDAIISEEEFEDEPLQVRPNDRKLASKLKLFRSFYILVVGYIYATRIVVYLFATMLDYRHQWVRPFFIEAVTLAFYFRVGMLFKPMCENPYLSVNQRSKRETEIELTT
eukprot:scaffold22592_cov129-Cylindrotheca_fusiformis.AAC.5